MNRACSRHVGEIISSFFSVAVVAAFTLNNFLFVSVFVSVSLFS